MLLLLIMLLIVSIDRSVCALGLVWYLMMARFGWRLLEEAEVKKKSWLKSASGGT
jgi:hypothetical protein